MSAHAPDPSAPDEASVSAELARLVQALESHLARRRNQGPERVPRGLERPLEPARTGAASSAASGASSPSRAPAPPRPTAGSRAPAIPSPASEERADAARTLDRGELLPRAPAEDPLPDLPQARENLARASACTSLGELRALVAGCTACGLSRTRTQTVFSDGPEQARVLFVGEAPGQSEDEQGVPFVGAAGQLLTDIIQKGMGLPRAQVAIANVLKCRPPGNRDPQPDEKALCTPYLDRQIELLDPEVIVALGLHAARHLLGSPLSMGRLRGKIHAWRGRKVIATYHPAYLLRTPSAKKDCWQDIQLAMRELGLLPPGAAPR